MTSSALFPLSLAKHPLPVRPNLADHLPDELPAVLAGLGIDIDAQRARRLFASVVGRGETDLLQVTGLPHATARAIAAACDLPRITVKERKVSRTDGFMKYLFQLADGSEVEAVRIPIPCEPPDTEEGAKLRDEVTGTWKGKEKKYVVCVSSQVGCALGCTFCATATLGFKRHLAPSEIIAQLHAVRAEADRPVRGVVFMGMGEPMLNYDAVIKAARICSHPAGLGISADAITVSTAGIVPGIRRFTAEGHKFRLAISLSSARPERRRDLMPIERKYPTHELVDAIRAHADKTGDRVTIAYVMLGGPEGNVGPEDAEALGRLLTDVPVRLDLIDVNGEVGGFRPPTREELKSFRNALDASLKQPVARRYSGGKDIDAACGMLAAKRAAG
jgi:23S rRNA (adenine2503-C2)-methyltransferase